MGECTIKSWTETPHEWLHWAVRSFLGANLARGGDLLLTDRNVTTLVRMGLGGAERGDPCLVGYQAETPIGFALWTAPAVGPLDLRWKTISAVGSWTDPTYRRSGIATLLRAEAMRRAKALGYERAVGPVAMTNPRGIQVFCEDYNSWPTHVMFEGLL